MLISKDHPDFHHYRPNVGVVVLNAENKVFVAQRIDTREEAWQLPQGGIDEGEDVLDAGFRELYEETSIRSVTFENYIPSDDQWLYYNLPEDLQKKMWGGGFKGQRQKWIVCRFTGHDSEINLKTEHPEFSVWKWINIKNLPELAIHFKFNIYKYISKEIKG